VRILLHTHAVLWSVLDSRRIPRTLARLLADPENEVACSVASAWEIALKQSIGKLTLPGPAETWLPPVLTSVGFTWLPVSPEDALRVRALPWHHRDPFDRLLVAQALGGWTLATADQRLAAYGVPTIWV
jgi:PIN domain nuclease of toxin-antitoxin system